MKTIATLGALAFLLTACGPSEGERGALLRPHQSPVILGNLALTPNDPVDPGCGRNLAPCQWVLLLQSWGTESVDITQTCIVGDTRNAFSIEGPEPATVDPENSAAVRITYSHASPSQTVDNIALVVQSSAEDFPTLVVPICGRMLDAADMAGAEPFECDSPVSVDPGARDDTLCQ